MSIPAAEPAEIDSQQFESLLANASPADATRQIEEELMSLDSVRQIEWISRFVRWLGVQSATRLPYASQSLLRSIPQLASRRIEAIERTYQVAPQHVAFRTLIGKGDDARDMTDYAQAERHYWQALRIFPLHGGYRVQYAHCLKEQEKYPEAIVHYWYALGLGAPQHDVEQHVLFAAGRAGIEINVADVGRRVAAFDTTRRAKNDWDAAPVEKDFLDFARLFWGDEGLVTSAFVIPYLLVCPSRKALFTRFLGAPHTVRRNRSLFVMLNRKGLPNV